MQGPGSGLQPPRQGQKRRITGVESVEFGAKRTGAMLQAGRAAAGMELVDVARETRVPIRHLKALEADKHDELPALPYAIGFVKAYARAIGLDGEAMANQFRGETSKSAHVPTPISLEPLDENRLPPRGLVLGSLAVVVAIIAGLSAWGAGVFDPPTPTAPTSTAPTETLAAEPAASGDAGLAATPAETAPGPATMPPGANGPVVLTASRDVWVKISDKASGKTLKVGVMSAGESYTVPAETPAATLWTGMAGALTASVGGQALPPLGGPVETVRNVSLLPADLIARTTPAAAPAAGGAAAPSGPTPIATVPVPVPKPASTDPKPIATIPGN